MGYVSDDVNCFTSCYRSGGCELTPNLAANTQKGGDECGNCCSPCNGPCINTGSSSSSSSSSSSGSSTGGTASDAARTGMSGSCYILACLSMVMQFYSSVFSA